MGEAKRRKLLGDYPCITAKSGRAKLQLDANSKPLRPDPTISFVHTNDPATCASPNLMTAEGAEEYPGFSGTGFFAKRGGEVFYITARHCLTKDHDADISVLAANLHIPYDLNGVTKTTRDYVQFDQTLSLRHESDDIAGKFVDLLVLTISRSTARHLYESLLKRAIMLPPSGDWLDKFVEHPKVKADFENGKGIRFSVVGFPHTGTASCIEYPNGMPIKIAAQGAKFSGFLGKGTGPDRYMLNDVTWPDDLNGFSGSPVIVHWRKDETSNYALAGVMVAGGGNKAQFIRISLVSEALKSPPSNDADLNRA